MIPAVRIICPDAPVRQVCRLLAVSRASAYRDRCVKVADQPWLEFQRYGHRRVAREYARRFGPINEKRVLNVMRREGLLCRARKGFKPQTTDSRHGYRRLVLIEKLLPTKLDQAWQAGLTYVRVRQGFVDLAVILDGSRGVDSGRNTRCPFGSSHARGAEGRITGT